MGVWPQQTLFLHQPEFYSRRKSFDLKSLPLLSVERWCEPVIGVGHVLRHPNHRRAVPALSRLLHLRN